MNERQGVRDDLSPLPRGALAPIIYASVIGDYSLLAMPFIVSGMIGGYGLSPSAAGRTISLQFVVMAAGSILTPILMERVRARSLLVAMTLLVGIGNIICSLATPVSALLVARAAIGFGEGALMAISGALAARSVKPERAYAVIGVVVALTAAAALVTTPHLVGLFGHRAIFAFMAGFALLSLTLAPLAPYDRIPADSSSRDLRDTVVIALHVPGAVRTLLAFLLLFAGGSGLWVFAERIGIERGYSLAELGTYLAVGQIVGIGGPVVLAMLAPRLRFPMLFFIPSVLNVACAFTFVYPIAGWMYSGSAAILSLCVMYLTPCFRTLMALIDRSGRVVALSVSMFAFGSAITPMVLSFVVGDGNSFAGVAAICAAFYAASFLLVLTPALRIGRVGPAVSTGLVEPDLLPVTNN